MSICVSVGFHVIVMTVMGGVCMMNEVGVVSSWDTACKSLTQARVNFCCDLLCIHFLKHISVQRVSLHVCVLCMH